MAAPGRVTPERVVDVAATIADAEGPDAVGLGAVARELGIRTPSLYNHVAGVDDLHRRLTVRSLTELGDRMRRAAVGRAGGDALRAIAAAGRDFAAEHPGLYAYSVPTSEVDDDEVREAGREAVAVVVDALVAFGQSPTDAVHAARTFRSAVHGFLDLDLAGGFGIDVDVDDSFDWMLDTLVAGLEARSSS